MKNILDYVEATAEKFSDKIAFIDGEISISYCELIEKAKMIGTKISTTHSTKKPYLVFLPRGIDCITSMLGVVYSGNFYVVADLNMPEDRLGCILDSLMPQGIIASHKIGLPKCSYNFENIVYVEDSCNIDEKSLSVIRNKQIDTDPLYVLYTSGSTGIPKGAIVTHKNVISYTTWVCETFSIDDRTIWGSQSPFYFSMSITDVFSTLFTGATLVIIQKQMFMFPINVLKYLQKNNVNSIYWVPSALGIMSNYKALDHIELPELKRVLFAGETMPTKVLNAWKEKYPDILYANLFGPTETTDICTYYVVNRDFRNDESLPIGTACNNCDVFVINEDGKLSGDNEEGELFVRGSFVIPGYYNNIQKTNEVFVQNPINNSYPEVVYKTGDVVKWKDGELIYIGRKDFQIKRMGFRIELGEIETACGAIKEIQSSCCIFNENTQKIIMYYTCNSREKAAADEIIHILSGRIPKYMLPDETVQIANLPLNANGKIDRKKLKQMYMENQTNE